MQSFTLPPIVAHFPGFQAPSNLPTLLPTLPTSSHSRDFLSLSHWSEFFSNRCRDLRDDFEYQSFETLEEYRRLVDNRETEAHYRYAVMLLEGRDTERNSVLAYLHLEKYLKDAAELESELESSILRDANQRLEQLKSELIDSLLASKNDLLNFNRESVDRIGAAVDTHSSTATSNCPYTTEVTPLKALRIALLKLVLADKVPPSCAQQYTITQADIEYGIPRAVENLKQFFGEGHHAVLEKILSDPRAIAL